MKKEESRKEKLARLLAENKTRLERDKLVSRYRQEMNYQMNIDQFVNLTVSHSMKKATYQKISLLQNREIHNFQQVLDTIENIKQYSSEYAEKLIILYYMDTVYTGGIYMKLKDFWHLIREVGDQPLSDIIVVDEKLEFGLCVEIEEYYYLVTTWGFE